MARIPALARFLWSLLSATVVLGASAAGLIWWAGWPLPDHWPTAEQWTAFADQPLTTQTLKGAAAVAGWLLWLLLATSAGLEAWTRISRRPLPVVLPRPLRLLAAGLLGTSVLTLTTTAHAAPTATTTSGHVPPGPATPAPHPAVPPSTPPQPPAVPTTGAHQPHHQTHTPPAAPARHGVDVPGGWLAWPVAVAVLAATAATLLHSKNIPPASALLRTLRTARQPSTDPTAEEPATPDDDLAALAHDATTSAPLTLGMHGTTSITFGDLPRAGTGLIGPGSHDALRGILAAATATHTTVIITDDLRRTLHTGHAHLPGLTTAANHAAALHELQLEIHHRYTTPTTGHAPLILLTSPPDQPARLAALAELGADHNIRLIIAGPWPPGATWTTDHHGHTTNGPTPIGRLNILTPEGLAQLSHTLHPTDTGPISPATAPPPLPASLPSPPFHLRILGPLTLTTPAEPAIHIRRSGSRQIAVYLALHPDGATRAELLDHIFGQLKVSTANSSLDTCLYELRRHLTLHDNCALQRIDDRYRLDPNLITVDWWQLQRHLRQGNLHHAVALYTGTLADGHTWHWLPEHRQAARHLLADTRAHLAQTADTADQALHHALAGLDIDPYSRACYQAAIDANLRLGNTDDAQLLRDQMRQGPATMSADSRKPPAKGCA